MLEEVEERHPQEAEQVRLLREVIALGNVMRERQRTYFRTRSKDALMASIMAEAAFDKALVRAEGLI